MARGNENGGTNLKLIFMKIKGLKKGEKVHIKQTEARGEKEYVDLEETINTVSGQLYDIKIREYQYQGETIYEVKVWLRDDKAGEIYALSVGLNQVGRAIINSLLNLKTPYGNLTISVYNKKKGEDDYSSVSVKHNGKRADWLYSLEEQKKYITENTIEKKGKKTIERDYFKLDQLLLDELRAKVIPNFDKTPEKFIDHTPITELVIPVMDTDELPF